MPDPVEGNGGAEPGAAGAPSGAEPGDEFGGLGGDFDEGLGEVVVEGGEPSAPGAPSEPQAPTPQPSAPTQPEPSPAPAQPTTAAAPAEVKPQAPAAPEGQEPSQPPTQLDPSGVLEQLVAGRDEFMKGLAGSTFRLSDAEVAELDSNPAEAVQKAMARVYVEAVSSTLHLISQHVPRMVQKSMGQGRLADDLDRAFRTRWPQINPGDAAHGEAVKRYGQAFMAANPRATMQDYIENVGTMVVTMLKLGATAPQARPNGAKQPQRPIASEPFQPAVGGVPQAPGAQPMEPYAGLGLDFDDDG